jgi:RNA polymerase sigma-70 factor (ECF subfamily)
MAERSDDLDDLLLLGKIASRDRAAFAELYDRLAAQVLGLLLRILDDRDLAQEVLAEVFREVWHEADRFRPGRSSPRGWVLLLARTRGLARLRSRPPVEEKNHAGHPLPGGVEVAARTGPQGGDEEAPDRSRLLAVPGERRTVVELAFFGGLTLSEIARRMAAPLPAVRSRVLLGMRELREASLADGYRR